jgi:dephospho-CoA kinase
MFTTAFYFSVVEPEKPAWQKIVAHFGREVLNDDGTLKREKLGEIIFQDASQRKILNSFTHPEIKKTMLKQILWHMFSGTPFRNLDFYTYVALLFNLFCR